MQPEESHQISLLIAHLCCLIASSSSKNPIPSRPPLHYRILNRCCLCLPSSFLVLRKYASGSSLNLELLIFAVHLIFACNFPDQSQNLLILNGYCLVVNKVAWVRFKSGQYLEKCRSRKSSPQVIHSKRNHLYYRGLLFRMEFFVRILPSFHRNYLLTL